MAKPLASHTAVAVIGGGVTGCSGLDPPAKSAGSEPFCSVKHNKPTSGTTWRSADHPVGKVSRSGVASSSMP